MRLERATTEAPPQPRRAVGRRVLRGTWSFARRKPLGGAAALVLIAMVLAAALADVIATHDPLLHDAPNRLRPPGLDFYFGTDAFGRDVFSRVVHAARLSLYLGAVSVAAGTSIGVLVGVTSAYAGGKLDLAVQRGVDVMLGFPFLVLAVVMVVALGASVNTVALAIALSLAPQVARLARSRALVVKWETYVLAAQTMGAGPLHIVWRHVLPNSVGPVIAYATGYFGIALVADAALSFLGLGVPPPEPSWGRMLQEGARQYLEVAPWLTIFPGAALAISALSFSLLGDALRDVLDPRSPPIIPAVTPSPGKPGSMERSNPASL